jgi:anti-sigma regulatory factor (Ser/Thr protein kinase)
VTLGPGALALAVSRSVVLVVEAGDTVEGDETRAAVGDDIGGKENEGIPVTRVDGQVADELLADGLRDLRLVGIEQWSGGIDSDLRGGTCGRERAVDGEDLAYGEVEILAVDFAEGAATEDDLVVAGLQEGDVVLAVVVGGEVADRAGIGVSDDDDCAGNDGSGGVGYGAGDCAGAGGLRDSRGGDERRGECDAKGIYAFGHAVRSPKDESGGSSIATTIEGLLLLARTETIDAEASSAPFLLPELIDEIVALLDVLLEERHILVRQESVAQVIGVVHADRSLIRIALLNVLHNAIKFSPENSTIRISYSCVSKDDRPLQRVCIRDSGPGIAEGEQERIFERFFTSASQRTVMQSGAGLGLSITKLIVDRSGGSVFFERVADDDGANCCISLPEALSK